MKNRWPVNLSLLSIEPLDTAGFLKKVREYDSHLHSTRRSELAFGQKDELDSFENQIVSLTGWLVLAYAGPSETTNCANADFHDWHLEIFENTSDHPPRINDPTPIISAITPWTERVVYRDGIRIQSLAKFFRLQDASYHATGHKAQKIRETGYLMWDDEHNVKNNRDTPRLFIPTRSVDVHIVQIVASALHNVVMMLIQRFQRVICWLNRVRLVSKSLGFYQRTN